VDTRRDLIESGLAGAGKEIREGTKILEWRKQSFRQGERIKGDSNFVRERSTEGSRRLTDERMREEGREGVVSSKKE